VPAKRKIDNKERQRLALVSSDHFRQAAWWHPSDQYDTRLQYETVSELLRAIREGLYKVRMIQSIWKGTPYSTV
jgi:hypothetical protein